MSETGERRSGLRNHNEPDFVNHPSHYIQGKYEVFDILMDWFPSDPLLWQVGKYIARCNHKGNKKTDLEKAKWYLEKAIALLQ